MPKWNLQARYEKSRIKDIKMENQILRSRLNWVEKILKKMTNMFKESKKENLGLGRQELSKDKKV